MQLLSAIARQVWKTFRSPGRIRLLGDRNVWHVLRLRRLGVSNHFEVVDAGDGALLQRRYATYEAYISHQRSKLDMLRSGGRFGIDGTDLSSYDIEFREILRTRLGSYPCVESGKSVLCLGARLGTEVKAFIDRGCFAVGIDLNPGGESEFVLKGDFHSTMFADNSIDLVYCNSLDHSFKLEDVFKEVFRILKEGGCFIAEIQLGESEGERKNTGQWESISWDTVADVQSLLERAGFKVALSIGFEKPWPGTTLLAERIRLRDAH